MHVHVPKLIRRLSNQLSPILIHLASLFLLLQPFLCDETAILTHLHFLSFRSAATPEIPLFLLMLIDCVKVFPKMPIIIQLCSCFTTIVSDLLESNEINL